jgi:hypothetical protein
MAKNNNIINKFNQILHYIFNSFKNNNHNNIYHFLILCSFIASFLIVIYVVARTKKGQNQEKKIKKTLWERMCQRQSDFASEFIKKFDIRIFSPENKLFIYMYFVLLFLIMIISIFFVLSLRIIFT